LNSPEDGSPRWAVFFFGVKIELFKGVSIIKAAFILTTLSVAFGAWPVQALDTCASVFAPTEGAVEVDPDLADKLVQLGHMLTEKEALRTSHNGLNDADLIATTQAGLRMALDATGTKWRLEAIDNGEKFVVLIPSDSSALGQFAMELDQTYGAELAVFPEKLLSMHANDAVITASGKSVFVAGPATIALAVEGKDLQSDPLVEHEIEHIETTHELRLKIPNAFYGSIRALEGVIPDHLIAKYEAYDHFMSFDECLAYFEQAHSSLDQLVELRSQNGKSKEMKKAMRTLSSALGHGLIVADRSRTTAEIFKTALSGAGKNNPTRYELGEHGEVVAKVKFANKELGFLITIEIPLVASHGVADSQNEKLMMNQLTLLEKKASIAFDQFASSRKLFELPSGKTPSRPLTLVKINKIRKLLNDQSLQP
jgi:hypothetical protein